MPFYGQQSPAAILGACLIAPEFTLQWHSRPASYTLNRNLQEIILFIENGWLWAIGGVACLLYMVLGPYMAARKQRKQEPLSEMAAKIAASRPEEPDSPWLGKMVIACPNEWDSMVIGLVVGTLPNSHDILIVDDLVRKSERIVFSPRVEFSKEKLEELAVLNPYERYNLLAKYSSVDLDKPKNGDEPLTADDYRRIAHHLMD